MYKQKRNLLHLQRRDSTSVLQEVSTTFSYNCFFWFTDMENSTSAHPSMAEVIQQSCLVDLAASKACSLLDRFARPKAKDESS